MEDVRLRSAINVKSWRPEHGKEVGAFLSSRVGPVAVVEERVGEMAGSGCAAVNVVSSLVSDEKDAAPFLALLAAGEGSRLWGVSLSLGLVKGLAQVLGRSLLEQSVRQARRLLASAPPHTCLLTGTDNLFEPGASSLLLADRAGTPFASSPGRGLHTFSVPIRVRRDGAVLRDKLEAVSQLGIMFGDSQGASVMFVEKPSHAQIEELVARFDVDFVYCNAFVFALSPGFAAAMARLYAARLSTGLRLFESTEFDWSGHVLAPLSLVHAKRSVEEWNSPLFRNAASRKYFPNDADWQIIWDCAVQLYAEFGPIYILDCGEDSLWFDCGLCSDLMAVHMQAFTDPRLATMFDLVRDGSCLLAGDKTRKETVIPASFESCVFSNCRLSGTLQGSAKRCVFIESTLENVRLVDGVENSLFYKVNVGTLEKVQSNTVYFSFVNGKGHTETGWFDVAANPKYGDLLNKPIPGVGKSFREIQKERNVQLGPL